MIVIFFFMVLYFHFCFQSAGILFICTKILPFFLQRINISNFKAREQRIEVELATMTM